MLTEALLFQVRKSRSGAPNTTRKPAGHTKTEAEIFTDYARAFTSPEATKTFADCGISADPRIMAAFMANVFHETGGMTLIRENPNFSAKRLPEVWPAYRVGKKNRDGQINRDSDGDGLSDLAEAHGGNPVKVMSYNYGFRMGNRKGTTDGYDFRGGGPLQSTGRDNYLWLEKQTGLPFASKPTTIEEPEHWPLVAALTFTKKVGNLCAYAEAGNFVAVCKAINCGSPHSAVTVVGMDDREAWYRAWTKALGVKASAPASAVYKVGSPKSAPIEAIQKRLNALMYGEGKIRVDGDFGPRTESAVMDFQKHNGVAPIDGVVGPKTWEELFAADAVCFPPPAAAQLGVAGLRAAGDPEIKNADNDRASGALLATLAAPALADNLGALDALKKAAEVGAGAQSSLVTVVELLKFACVNVLPIAALFGAFLLYRRFGSVVYERVEKWTRPVGGGAS